ncbi:MAG: hypothetical protein M3R35_03765 [Candidatus Eremiobacteraeota bacterium]|nr:hypothetical protein [Candidatus Eremiobacteraeota bacterium]
MADSKTYDDVVRPALERLRGTLGNFGIALPNTDSGAIAGSGFAGSYLFDEGARTLTVTIDKHPLLFPKALVWKTIDDAIAKAKEAG